MSNPSDFTICASCFTVLDTLGNCSCDPRNPCRIYLNWARYKFLNSSLPLIPKKGGVYPLPSEITISRDNALLSMTLDEGDIDEYYEAYA